MNRTEEYQALREKLETCAPALEDTLARAQKRLRRRRRRIVHACGSLCAVFALFVALVNFSVPVAYACARIPGLRELAEAVTFSRSLRDAVENEYVQPLSLSQTKDGITAKVEYLIVDQKQVNVFFRLEGEGYQTLDAEPDFRLSDGSHISSCIYGSNDWDVPAGQLQSVTLEVTDIDLPSQLQLTLSVFSSDNDWMAAAPVANGSLPVEEISRQTVDFTFLLEYDPSFTAQAIVYPIHKTVEIDGQQVILRQMEVYPTHLRLQVEDHPDNTADLQRLYFYIETDWGMRFDTESNGVLSFRSGENRMTTYRADSTYFYEAQHLRVVITAAEWLDKGQLPVYVDLVNGTAGEAPEGMTFVSAEKTADGWCISFKAEQRKWASSADLVCHQLFSGYLDAQCQRQQITRWSRRSASSLPLEEQQTHFIESIYLEEDYPDDDVWLLPYYSHVWRAAQPLIVDIR